MSKHIFIVAGDASGDVYGAYLISALRELDPNITVAGLGGDRMKATGMTFLYNLVKEFSVMGFIPVILGMPKVMRFLEIILDYLDSYSPDVVVLIDYPGFNLYLATHTKPRNIPTLYYVTPQIWAWASWRIKKIKKFINKMLVIFPFEVPFYQKADVPVEYVGHPLLDRLASFQPAKDFSGYYHLKEKVLTLLPGSRKAEIQANLPVHLWTSAQLSKKFSIQNICVGVASTKHRSLVEEIIQQFQKKFSLPEIQLIFENTYNLLCHTHLALVTSGTVTLETAMFECPMVVTYRVPKFHKWVVENTSFLQCKYFALPNIISEKKVVPEYLVTEIAFSPLVESATQLWEDTEERKKCKENLTQLKKRLERPGASKKAARAILSFG